MIVFRKEKMIDRVTKEGRASLINDVTIEIMDNLDGQSCNPFCWARSFNCEPVFLCVGKDGEGCYVNELDCEVI